MGAAGPLRITVLGSGTSVGVPTPGCHCGVCTSDDPRDNRLRPSVLLQYGGHNVVIDTTPDFRTQMLRAKVDRLDAVLFTHSHADHIMGLDDVRPFNFRQRTRIPHLCVGRHHERHPALLPVHFHRRGAAIFGPPTRNAHTLNGRRSSFSDWSSRPSGCCTAVLRFTDFVSAARLISRIIATFPRSRWSSCAASMCCSWTRCATSRIPRIRPSSGPFKRSNNLHHGELSLLTSATTCRTWRPKTRCRRTIRLAYDGLEITVERGHEITLGAPVK